MIYSVDGGKSLYTNILSCMIWICYYHLYSGSVGSRCVIVFFSGPDTTCHRSCQHRGRGKPPFVNVCIMCMERKKAEWKKWEVNEETKLREMRNGNQRKIGQRLGTRDREEWKIWVRKSKGSKTGKKKCSACWGGGEGGRDTGGKSGGGGFLTWWNTFPVSLSPDLHESTLPDKSLAAG